MMELKYQTGHFKRRIVFDLIVPLLLTMVMGKEITTVITALHKKGFTVKLIAASKIVYHVLKESKRREKKILKSNVE